MKLKLLLNILSHISFAILYKQLLLKCQFEKNDEITVKILFNFFELLHLKNLYDIFYDVIEVV